MNIKLAEVFVGTIPEIREYFDTFDSAYNYLVSKFGTLS